MPLIPIPSGKPKIYPAGIAIRMFATKEIHIIAFTSERPLSEFAWIICAPSTNCLNELASMINGFFLNRSGFYGSLLVFGKQSAH